MEKKPEADIKGISLETFGSEVYFLRHAQSMANCGKLIIDSPLSDEGIEQAKKLKGYFDMVIISPCRRTLETLHYSGIQYGSLRVDHDIREMVQDLSSSLLLENRNHANLFNGNHANLSNGNTFIPETIEQFRVRANRFTLSLERYCRELYLTDKSTIVSDAHNLSDTHNLRDARNPSNSPRGSSTMTNPNQQKKKVLILSHGFFFNAWFRRGCYPTPYNARIYRIH